jgi:hypothetical protein
LGLAVNSGAEVFLFPQIGGFVGGDTVAGMLAVALEATEEPSVCAKQRSTLIFHWIPEFQMEFGMAMMFPEADVDTCNEEPVDEEPFHDGGSAH